MSIHIRSTQTLSITSGKGGVGKTTVSCNLAYTLAQKGKKVLVFDGDLGLANVEIFFGVQPRGHILDVIHGRKTLADIITTVIPGVDLISGGNGLTEFNQMSPFERKALVDAVSGFEYKYDYLLIDTAPGISDSVLYLNSAAQDRLIVLTPDAASLTDSYALIKVLHHQFREGQFSILCNQVRNESEGLALFQKFSDVVSRFLSVRLQYWGHLPTDAAFRKSAAQQRLVLRHEQVQDIRSCFEHLAERLELRSGDQSLEGGRGRPGLSFFWDQIVGVA